MKFTTKSIFVFVTTAIFIGASAQSTTLKKQNGYLASQTSGSISLLSRWNSFKPNTAYKTFADPQQKMLSQMGLAIQESKISSKTNQFYGGQAYKGNNVPRIFSAE